MIPVCDRSGWWWPLGLVAGLATALVSAIGAASAASLGGANGPSIAAFAFASSSLAPTVLAYENFTGTTGSSLNGTTTDSGGFTWVANAGSWTVQSDEARSSNNPTANLLFDSGVSNGSVEAVLSRNGNTSWTAGVVFNANSSLSDGLVARWESNNSGTISLTKRISGSTTTLGTVTALYPSTIPGSVTVRLESPATSVINVYLDGVLKVTYTLTSGDRTTFKNSTHQYTGLTAFQDTSSSFDDFHVDA